METFTEVPLSLEKQRAIPTELVTITYSLTQLEEIFSDIEARTKPIRASDDCLPKEPQKEAVPSCSLAEDLYSIRYRIKRLVERAQILLSQLEI